MASWHKNPRRGASITERAHVLDLLGRSGEGGKRQVQGGRKYRVVRDFGASLCFPGCQAAAQPAAPHSPAPASPSPASQPPPEKVKKRKGAPAPGQCHGEVRGDASVPRSFASVATCPLRLRYQISFLLAASSVLSVRKLKMQLWVSNPDCRRNASFPGHVHARRRAASCGWNSSKVIHVFNSGRRSSLNWSSVLPNSFLCSSLAPIT